MRSALTAGLVISLGLVAPAFAQSQLKQITKIEIPGKPLTDFDISWVDQASNRYFLADRSNAGADIIDALTNKYVGRVDSEGPNGVVVGDGMIWVSNNDSTVKVFDAKTLKLVNTISTGGKKRADEVDFDPKDHVYMVVNADDEPPFITLISTEPGNKILGKIVVDRATDGVEQPVYDAATGFFYVAVPQFDKNKSLGGVIQIDPKDPTKIAKTFEIKDCIPQGHALGANGNQSIGCHAMLDSPPPAMGLFNPKTGDFTRIPGIGGGDEIAYNAAAGQYYNPANHLPGNKVAVGVIDAKTNKWLYNIPLPDTSNTHSVATDESNKEVFLPVKASPGFCDNGCVAVYGP
jgi:DNA-binding beta-propeller fold protein YncE